MAVSRGVVNVIFSIIGVLILLTTVVVIASVLGSDAPVKPIIYKSIELRNATDPVDKATLITDLDDLITQAENEELGAQWDRMMGCLATACPDEAYLDLILVTVAEFEKELPESALLINLIAAAKYWGSPESILEFSKALSMANEQVEDIRSKAARKQWQMVVDCNGVCPEKNDLFFELIETVVQ